MASNGCSPIKRVEVKLNNIAKHRAIGSGVRKLIESDVITRRPLNKTELNPLYDEDSDNSVEQISGSEEPVSLDNSETRTVSKAPVSLDNPETRLGSAKYDDTYSSCSDSEIMEIFERSNEERKKRRKVWEERKKIKKKKCEEIQISDSESDCEVLAKSNLSISPPCSNSSRRSSSSLQVLEDRVSASKSDGRSSSLQVLEDRVSASKPEERSSSLQVLEDRISTSKPDQQSGRLSDCFILKSQKSANIPVNLTHKSQPSSSSQTNSKQMMFTKKNLDHTFDTDTGDEEEFQRKEFERNSTFKLKKLRIDIKEEHHFLRSVKPSRVHLKSSRAHIRRLFYTQKKNLDEPIVFKSLFSPTPGLVCPHCDLRLGTNECLKFTEHVQNCKYLSTHDTIDDDVLIMSHEIDVDVRIEEVEISEETRTCPKCNEEVPMSMVDSHTWFHRPYPCSVCFHRYIKKTDIEDHIINDHATHFMSNLIPFWRSEEAMKDGPGTQPVPSTSNPGIPLGAVKALIREADGSCKTVYIAQIPPGTILPGNPTQIVINNQNYQILNTVGGHQSVGTPMPSMPLPQQPLPRENLIQGSSNHRLPLNTPQQYMQPGNQQPLPRPNFSLRNYIRPKSGPFLPLRFPTGAPTQFRPRSLNPMIRSSRPTMFIPSMQGMKLDEDGAPIQESDPLSFDETQQEDPLAI